MTQQDEKDLVVVAKNYIDRDIVKDLKHMNKNYLLMLMGDLLNKVEKLNEEKTAEQDRYHSLLYSLIENSKGDK